MDSSIGAVDDSTAKHDPLCPTTTDPHGVAGDCDCDCNCDLIARVREDERGYAKQTSAAVMAYGEGKRDGYAAALRDAVEAVKGLPPITDAYPTNSPAGGEGLSIVTRTWLCNRDSAVAAIEALGGKR